MTEADALNWLTERIIAGAIEVCRELGPGMLESAYEACLACELVERGMAFERQKPLPLTYKGRLLDCGYRVDLLVEGSVIVEIKCVERFDRVHFAQVKSYLKQSGCKVGLLFNFNTTWLVECGLKRIVNHFPDVRKV